MNLLGGQGETDGAVKVVSDLQRSFANFGNVCLDNKCCAVEDRELYKNRNEKAKLAVNDVFERYLLKKRNENANIADDFFNKEYDHYINKISGYQCN